MDHGPFSLRRKKSWDRYLILMNHLRQTFAMFAKRSAYHYALFPGSDVFLCYKKATVNTNYVTYQPSLLFRYPKNEYSSLPLPLDIQLFSMPMGASLEAWPKEADLPRAVFAKFVLTVSGNRSQVYSGGKLVQKLYGAAMSFYEPFPKEKLKAEQLKELTRNIGEDGVVFYANKSICILSRWPFYDAFQVRG